VGRITRGVTLSQHSGIFPGHAARRTSPITTDEELSVRRAAAVLVTTLLAAGGTAVLAPPAAATGIVPRDLTITVTGLGPENRTCRIDADLYVPAGADRHHRAPALLATNGFGGTKEDQADLAQGFGEQGYVTLSYTGIGFVDGDNCPITLDDREHDGAAAGQLLRFLGGDRSIHAVDDATGETVVVDQVIRQDRTSSTPYDPAVGMTGGSYGGQIQFATAGFEHAAGTDRLDAIVPLITWNDLSYSLAPENSALPGGTAHYGSVSSDQTGVFKYEWAALFTSVGVGDGATDAAALLDPATTPGHLGDNCGNFEPQVCRALVEVATTGYPSRASVDYLRSNSVASYLADVQVPTLIGQGQADTLFNLQESIATYTALREQGTPVSLVWQSWGHSDSSPEAGELDLRHPADSYQGRQALAWFDHYVRGTGPAPAQDFRYFRDWVFDGTNVDEAYAVSPSYPPATTARTWHLAGGQTVPGVGGAVVGDPATLTPGGGSLVPDGTAVTAGTSGYGSPSPVGPNYSETSAVDQAGPVSDPPGTAISFTSAPLEGPVDVVGSPRVTVRLDSPTAAAVQGATDGQLVVFAKLYDVGPDGTPVELPNRLVSPVRVADVGRPVSIELPAIVHRFEARHRLALVLAGGDLAYRGSNARHAVTLTTGPGEPQTLVLPVVG
jgi:putative CocE/NonD family hydrolase